MSRLSKKAFAIMAMCENTNEPLSLLWNKEILDLWQLRKSCLLSWSGNCHVSRLRQFQRPANCG